MQALGEHIIVTIPKAKLATGGGIVLPENTSGQYWYGLVESIGAQAGAYFDKDYEMDHVGKKGDLYVLFDKDGSVAVPLDPNRSDSVTVVIHQTQVYATLWKSDLLSRGLPLVESQPETNGTPVGIQPLAVLPAE